jgi:ankyrin repeat protein
VPLAPNPNVPARAIRGQLWPAPEPGERWSTEGEERQARLAVLRTFSVVGSANTDATISALKTLASKAPASANSSHLRWIDAADSANRLEWPLIALAASACNAELVAYLLSVGADPDAQDCDGLSPMWHALRLAHTGSDTEQSKKARAAIFLNLLNSGANPNGAGGFIDGGMRPILFDVAALGDPALVELFLNFGARADAKSRRGAPALCFLSAESYPSGCFELLARHGARLDERDAAGDTALLVAARDRNAEAARELLRLGADERALSADGLSWREIARGEPACAARDPLGAQKLLALLESVELNDAARAARSGETQEPDAQPRAGAPRRV